MQVARVNTKLTERQQLDPAQVKQSAKARGYDNVFYATLGKMERKAEQGAYPHDPYEFLRTGRGQRADVLLEVIRERPVYNEPAIPARRPQPVTSATRQAFERSLNKLSRATTPKTRTQDVRSEEEKARDYEQER
ncbi:hypothetical protein A0257_22725 (plasmid) [Hymenobacter psoromatis]|nr:hypothetical protein A0257_22725 [Hymenobacter psoromatis]